MVRLVRQLRADLGGDGGDGQPGCRTPRLRGGGRCGLECARPISVKGRCGLECARPISVKGRCGPCSESHRTALYRPVDPAVLVPLARRRTARQRSGRRSGRSSVSARHGLSIPEFGNLSLQCG